jgi:hypothetical protein
MKTVGSPVSCLEEVRTKVQEALSVLVEVLGRLPQEEETVMRSDVVVAAKQLEESRTIEEVRASLSHVIHNCSSHLCHGTELSLAGRALKRWLEQAERLLCAYEKNPRCNWVSFLRRWPRFWKARLLSVLGSLDMAVWVGEAIESRVSGILQRGLTDKQVLKEKKPFLRCWKKVEEAVDAPSISQIKTLLRRVRKDREREFLKTLNSPSSEKLLDVGAFERAIGLEEFLLKLMIEKAAMKVQEGKKDVGNFEYVCQVLEEHIRVIGDRAAEASAMTLVKETVEAEKKYLLLCKAFQKNNPYMQNCHEYHEVHGAIIDAYMELSDTKSLRGVMLCYELPVFTQVLYDQRKHLDTLVTIPGDERQAREPSSLLGI